MHYRVLLLTVCLALIRSVTANDIEPGKEFYSATRLTAPIVLDGNLNEWAGVPVLSDPRFATPKGSGTNGTYVLFEQYQGGVWTGPDDHTSAVQIAWDSENVYFGFVVTDDYHENSANSPWNGDSVQLMIANADRDFQIALYNYSLGGIETALGDVIVEHEAGPGETEAVVRRDTVNKKTIYEIKLPAVSLDLTAPIEAGTQFGLGMAINDGDDGPGQNGQRGWGGLGAHAIVFGKTPSETALITLSTNTPGTDRLFFSAIDLTFTTFSFRATDKGASIVDPASAVITINGQAVTPTFTKAGDATDFTYTFPTRLLPGSNHSYSIEVKDTLGNAVTAAADIRLPAAFFPAANLPSPNVTGSTWAVRHIFGLPDLVTDLATALAAVTAAGTPNFNGVSVDSTSNVINFGTGGLFGDGLAYPDPVVNDPSGAWIPDDFVQLAVGHIEIPEEGQYTFGVHSDDGFALRIRGGEVVSVSGNGQADPADPEAVLHPLTTGDSNTRAVYHLKKGVYRIEFFWYDRSGGEYGEIYAAKGAFLEDADTDQWRLIGDTAPGQEFFRLGVDNDGWTVISSDPGGDELNNWFDAMAELDASGGNPTKYDSLNVGDPNTNAGVQPFPKNTDADDDDFVLRANAMLVVPADGTYVIGFNSDDGAYVKITGRTFTEIIANATDLSVIDNGDTVICDCLTGDSATRATITLPQGTYPIEAGMFDRSGGAYLRVSGGQLGSPQIAVLTRNGAGTFRTGEALRLTAAAPGVEESLAVQLTRSGNNLTIQWTPAGGTLEFAPSLSGTPAWTAVGTANPATVQIGTGNGFYRVRQ